MAEHHASLRGRHDLAGGTALLLHAVREHYLVYEPLDEQHVVIVAASASGVIFRPFFRNGPPLSGASSLRSALPSKVGKSVFRCGVLAPSRSKSEGRPSENSGRRLRRR
jgi:hypothetical protein